MLTQLDKILNFVKKTGDKAVVFKDNGEFVVMRLDDYDNLINQKQNYGELSEGEFLNKINRDIALWRESQRELNTKENEINTWAEFNTPRYDSLSQVSKDLNPDQDFVVPEMNLNDFNPLEPDLDSFDEEEDDYYKDDYDGYNESNLVEDYNEDYNNDDEIIESVDEETTSDDYLPTDIPTDHLAAEISETDEEFEEFTPKINNFGYANPMDTGENSDYGNITPPPDR